MYNINADIRKKLKPKMNVLLWVVLIFLIIIVAKVIYVAVMSEIRLNKLDKMGGFFISSQYNCDNHDLSNLSLESRNMICSLDHVHKDVNLWLMNLLGDFSMPGDALQKYTAGLISRRDMCSDVPDVKPIVVNIPELSFDHGSSPKGSVAMYTDGDKVFSYLSDPTIFRKFRHLQNIIGVSPQIYLLNTGTRKIFTGTLNPECANSAEYHKSDHKIYIYRTEELQKVAIHELLHASGIENSYGKLHQNQILTKNLLRTDGRPILYTESIVEAMARYINVVLCSRDNATFNYLWAKEVLFGLYQTAKILYKFGFQNVEQFYTLGNRKITESTSAVEYYIFTPLLMIRFNKFYDLLRQQDSHGIIELMNTVSTLPGYTAIVNSMIVDFQNNYLLSQKLYDSFRMSVVESFII